jgi:hypothetical protein
VDPGATWVLRRGVGVRAPAQGTTHVVSIRIRLRDPVPRSAELGLGWLLGPASRGHPGARAQAFLRARISAVLFSRAMYGISSA